MPPRAGVPRAAVPRDVPRGLPRGTPMPFGGGKKKRIAEFLKAAEDGDAEERDPPHAPGERAEGVSSRAALPPGVGNRLTRLGGACRAVTARLRSAGGAEGERDVILTRCYTDRRSNTLRVICWTNGSLPANPWGHSVQPVVNTVPPRV